MRLLKLLGLGVFLLAVTLGAVRVLNPLPPLEPRAPSPALAGTDDTPLGQGAARAMAGHPSLSGIHLLNDGRSAFAVRALLARAAVRSLDVQYYIWHGDLSGTLLLDELRAAAARGVRVRLLLDDNGTSGLDGPLAALDAHPDIEVRLFNPFVLRRPKVLGLLADPFRLNRRMHHKRNKASCLGLLSNAAVLWNTVQIERVVGRLRAGGAEIDPADLAHVWPLQHARIVPNGTCFLGWPQSRTPETASA